MSRIIRTKTHLDERHKTVGGYHFCQSDDKEGNNNLIMISITDKLFEELSSPNSLTVTIEPGYKMGG